MNNILRTSSLFDSFGGFASLSGAKFPHMTSVMCQYHPISATICGPSVNVACVVIGQLGIAVKLKIYFFFFFVKAVLLVKVVRKLFFVFFYVNW